MRSGDLMVDFDDARMRQVLVNLLGHAVQDSDASHPIRFELRGDGREVLASVSNRGIPISAGSIGSIFDPMMQLAKSRPEPSQRPAISMGLGLFIAREIVKAHGAQIDFTSATEQGTVFTIRMLRNRPSSC